MRVLIVFAILLGVPILVGMALRARPRTRPARLSQPPVEQLPVDDPGGAPRPPVEIEGRRPDGSPVPGSQEYRNRQGKP